MPEDYVFEFEAASDGAAIARAAVLLAALYGEELDEEDV